MTSEDIKHQLIITKHNSLWGRSFGLGFRSSVRIVLICSVLVRNLIIVVIRDASKLSLGWCLDWAAVIITIIWQRWCWSWRWCWLSGRRCSWLGRKWAIEVIVAVTSNPFFIFIVVIKCVLGFGGCNRSSAFVFTLKRDGSKTHGSGHDAMSLILGMFIEQWDKNCPQHTATNYAEAQDSKPPHFKHKINPSHTTAQTPCIYYKQSLSLSLNFCFSHVEVKSTVKMYQLWQVSG